MHWNALITAVCFLTRLPVGRLASSDDQDALQRCPIYFPLVGALIGVFTVTVVALAGCFWPMWLAVVVALAAEAMFTGAFHEDAVADFFDAFGGGWTREDVLRILKDSRVGSYGVVALVGALALRGGAMAHLASRYGFEQWLLWAVPVVGSAMLGRLMIVVVMSIVPPISDRNGLSRDIGCQVGGRAMFIATLWTIPVAVFLAWLLPVGAALSAGALVVVVGCFSAYVKRRLGGITGDCLGCICYLSQIVVLLAAAAK